MPLEGDFTFVLIPADETQPITERTAPKAGGLTDDALVRHARAYFHELTGARARAEQLERASDAEKKALAAQIRQQMSGGSPETSQRLSAMDDATVVDLVYRSQVAPSCDISALTVPLPGNQHAAVSLYAADNGRAHGLPPNPRATALLTACGHQPPADGGVRGDAFVGRALDDEAADVWERTDFGARDADPAADWCRVARSAGGGGGAGRGAAASVSRLVQQQLQMGGAPSAQSSRPPVQILDGSLSPPSLLQQQQQQPTADANFGMNGAVPVRETWGTWTQTDEEVEIKFPVAAGTKAKYCKVAFSRTSVKVMVAGQVLLQGTTFDPIATDESTFTLQDEGPTGRELCVTMGKVEQGRVWAYVAR